MSIIFLILLVCICLYCFGQNMENFICSKQMDDKPRYVMLNDGGGIMYVSNSPPANGIQTSCLNHYMNEYDNSTTNATCFVQSR